jgi:hypothetical protein
MRIRTIPCVLIAFLALAVVPACLVASPVPLPPAQSTFSFTGVCLDCINEETETNIIHAILVLQNYHLGDPILPGHLVSFTYGGSDIVDPFTIDPGNLDQISGAMPTVLPGSSAFFIRTVAPGGVFLGMQTYVNPADSWIVFRAEGVDDYGFTYAWDGAAVPEPSSLGLALAGLAALGIGRLRRGK